MGCNMVRQLILDEHIQRIIKLPSQDFTTIEYESGEKIRIYKKQR